MSVRGRRDEIIRMLTGGARKTIPNLAKEFGVSVSTIKRDLLSLTVDERYPINTERGNGGGVILKNYRHVDKPCLNDEQKEALLEAIKSADGKTAEILQSIIRIYGK